MISLILLFLIVFWLTGYLQVPLFAIPILAFGPKNITLNDILVLLVIIWLLDMLPYPFQQIAFVLFLLWILATIGIISLVGFSDIVLIALIVGLIAFLARGTRA